MAKKGDSGFLSGIIGLFGTIINCDADDESMYCNIMKFFNIFMVIVIVIYVLYIAYQYLPQIKILKRMI